MLLPANILDLNRWKLTLPTGVPGLAAGLPGIPTEIRQPQLACYTDENFYRRGAGVVLSAKVGGINQVGSKYPRCELREMTADGKANASWSPMVGRHTLTILQQINELPPVKSEVVAGQIHDSTSFVLLIWVVGNRDGATATVMARGVHQDDVVLDPAYKLGQNLSIQIVAEKGTISVGAFSMPWMTGGCYFKAGCYTQSNVSKGDDPAHCAEVLIRNLAVTHEP